MAITILNVLVSKIGEKDSYTGEDFENADLPMLGGCQRCEASIAAYNAYPSRTGYLQCKDCIDNNGFDSVVEYEDWQKAEADPEIDEDE